MERRQLSRIQIVSAMIAAPALLAAIALSLSWGVQALHPADTTVDGSLAQAIVDGDVERAYAFISSGHDPNAPIAFAHPDLTGGRTVKVSPLLLAVAARRDDVVNMLLSVGADVTLPQNQPAVCLANQTDAELAGIFRKGIQDESRIECPSTRSGTTTPLLAFVQ